MPEYQRHAFEKDWHESVEEFIEESDEAFDSPKYFIKFCVNKYIEEHENKADLTKDDLDGLVKKINKLAEK